MRTLVRRHPDYSDTRREFGRFFDDSGNDTVERTWSPRADIVEFDDRYEVRIDLPGVARDAVAIRFEESELRVSGERPANTSKGRTYYRCECNTGPFVRRFKFPSGVEASRIGARLENGVLTVSVPKGQEIRPREISID